MYMAKVHFSSQSLHVQPTKKKNCILLLLLGLIGRLRFRSSFMFVNKALWSFTFLAEKMIWCGRACPVFCVCRVQFSVSGWPSEGKQLIGLAGNMTGLSWRVNIPYRMVMHHTQPLRNFSTFSEAINLNLSNILTVLKTHVILPPSWEWCSHWSKVTCIV